MCWSSLKIDIINEMSVMWSNEISWNFSKVIQLLNSNTISRKLLLFWSIIRFDGRESNNTNFTTTKLEARWRTWTKNKVENKKQYTLFQKILLNAISQFVWTIGRIYGLILNVDLYCKTIVQ